ncbi:unnamed protein product [Leptosia nina]|uniref:Uncharacterized protein n=1 Tax=Leptosia nina TaxID=320188 RepID=A0AAV1K7F6_9NEOP
MIRNRGIVPATEIWVRHFFAWRGRRSQHDREVDEPRSSPSPHPLAPPHHPSRPVLPQGAPPAAANPTYVPPARHFVTITYETDSERLDSQETTGNEFDTPYLDEADFTGYLLQLLPTSSFSISFVLYMGRWPIFVQPLKTRVFIQ